MPRRHFGGLDLVFRNHPILNALMRASFGALAATIRLLAYQSLAPSTQKSDAELDREAARTRR